MVNINRLVGFTQRSDSSWSTPSFKLGERVGKYKIVELPDSNIGPKYELIRETIYNGLSIAHIHTSDNRYDLVVAAESDLFDKLGQTYKNDGPQMIHTMIKLIKFIDKSIKKKEKVNTGLAYDYAKLREKVTFLIRIRYSVLFFYKGFFSNLFRIMHTKKMVRKTLNEIFSSLLLIITQEITENGECSEPVIELCNILQEVGQHITQELN